jgi:hypothetical protein
MGKDINLRFIGDVHGNRGKYLNLVKKATHTIQVGDLDHSYEYLNQLSPAHHKFLGGNHDNYDVVEESPHYLGDYGVHSVPDFGDVFFVRGAWSIDGKMRRVAAPHTWWEKEQLDVVDLYEACELYEKVKPDTVISHECPLSIVPFVTTPKVTKMFGYEDPVIKTRTNVALQEMLNSHKPKLWVFGHYHNKFDRVIDGTRFVCLPILGVLDFESNLYS